MKITYNIDQKALKLDNILNNDKEKLEIYESGITYGFKQGVIITSAVIILLEIFSFSLMSIIL